MLLNPRPSAQPNSRSIVFGSNVSASHISNSLMAVLGMKLLPASQPVLSAQAFACSFVQTPSAARDMPADTPIINAIAIMKRFANGAISIFLRGGIILKEDNIQRAKLVESEMHGLSPFRDKNDLTHLPVCRFHHVRISCRVRPGGQRNARSARSTRLHQRRRRKAAVSSAQAQELRSGEAISAGDVLSRRGRAGR